MKKKKGEVEDEDEEGTSMEEYNTYPMKLQVIFVNIIM